MWCKPSNGHLQGYWADRLKSRQEHNFSDKQKGSSSKSEDRRWYLIEACSFSQVNGFPAIDKGSQGEIHVFYCGSALPAAHSHDSLATPDSSCSIEVEEATSSKLDILLALAVEVQGDFLSLRHNMKTCQS